MKHAPLGLLMLWVLAACGKGLAPPPESKPKAGADQLGSRDQVTMKGINLYLHDTRPTHGTPRKPTFWVRAEESSLTDEHVWSFEKAHAVIYARSPDSEDIVFEAARGRFREDERAYLEGGVVGQVGRMVFELQDIEWVNADAEARTDNPVQITDGETHLDAATLRLYPNDRRFVLTDVKGVIRLERKKP